MEKATRDDATALQPLKSQIMNLAKSPRKEIRWHVAQLLPRLRMAGSAERRRRIALLMQWLEQDPSAIVRVNALQSLVELMHDDPRIDAQVRARLSACLNDRSAAVRARARKLIESIQT